MSKLNLKISYVSNENNQFKINGTLSTSSGHLLCSFTQKWVSVSIKVPKIVSNFFEFSIINFAQDKKIEIFTAGAVYKAYLEVVSDFWKENPEAKNQMFAYHSKKAERYCNNVTQEVDLIETIDYLQQ